MFPRLLIESLRRGGHRKLLAFAVVAMGVLAATAAAAVLLAAGDRLAAEMGSYGANIEVLPVPGNDTFDAAGLAGLRDIFWRNNIVAMAPLLPLRVRFEPSGTVAPLVGTWFDVAVDGEWRTGLPAVRPTVEIDGRWPAGGAPETVLGRRLAARLGVAPGQRVEVELGGRRRGLQVVGVAASGGEEEEHAFAALAVVEELAGRTAGAGEGPLAGRATRAEVFALTSPEPERPLDPQALDPEAYERWYCTAYPSSVAFQIGEALPDARALVRSRIAGATAEVLGRLRRILLTLAALVLAGAALGVTAVMTATMLERRLEAGLLIALGAEPWRVALFFVTEAALVGLGGGLAGGLGGLGAGRLLGRAVFDVAVPWAPVLLPGAVAAGVLVAVAGALPPVVRVFRARPASTLKEATA